MTFLNRPNRAVTISLEDRLVKGGNFGSHDSKRLDMGANSRIGQSYSTLSHGRHGAPPPALRHTTISQHTAQQVYVIKTRKTILFTINLTTMCTTPCLWRCGCRQRCPQPCMGCLLWQFWHNRSLLWTYWHRPVAWLPRQRWGRQSEHGWHGDHLGGSTMVDLLRW